jgi:D-3-phosphoglycerate dehydrogenase
MQPIIDRFRAIFEANDVEPVVPPVQERLSEEDLLHWIEDIDGAICGDDAFTERVLRSAPRLKVISKWGTGIDTIDATVARQLGITIKNTPNAFSQPVADTVLGYILCFARRLSAMDREIRAGRWTKLTGVSLHECTLGVIGVGNIGKEVVHRAVAFNMEVLGNDVVDMPQDFVAQTGIVMVSKDDLLCQADFVSLNCDLNPTTYHLINEERFLQMKETAYLVNTARGAVVDESDLVRALQKGWIAGAALDVFEQEPLPLDSPLRHMDNVLLAPHNANNSPRAWENVHENTVRHLIEELRRLMG